MFNPEFLATENNDPNDENDLIQYLQKQSPEVFKESQNQLVKTSKKL